MKMHQRHQDNSVQLVMTNVDGDGDDSYELPQHKQGATQETAGIIDLETLLLEKEELSNLGIFVT